MPDAGCLMPDACRPMPDARCPCRCSFRCSSPVVRYANAHYRGRMEAQMSSKLKSKSFPLIRTTALALVTLAGSAAQPWHLLAQGQAPEPAKGVKYATIDEAGMKEWLTYLSSDELQGRQIYTEGYGLAAGYVADHLRQWGVKPIGDHGS